MRWRSIRPSFGSASSCIPIIRSTIRASRSSTTTPGTILRTTTKKYDLVVFALIDSLTLQSSFSGVRLESYMFTEESFRAVRDRLAPDGLLVVYNYFREKWLVDRLANTAAIAFGAEPRVHVHEARAYLGIMLAGPRLATLKGDPVVPEQVTAYNQSHAPAPARMLDARRVGRSGHRRLAVPLHEGPPHPAALRRRAAADPGRSRSPRCSGCCAGRAAAGRGSSSSSAPASCCSRPRRSSSSRCCGARPGSSRRWRSPRC